jgi:acyl carrier protein
MISVEKVASRVEEVIRLTLNLKDDVLLKGNSDLVNEIGLDSIEAFEAVATLHELLGVRIPDRLDPKSLATINSIAAHILNNYEQAKVEAFLSMDIRTHLASLQDDDSLV